MIDYKKMAGMILAFIIGLLICSMLGCTTTKKAEKHIQVESTISQRADTLVNYQRQHDSLSVMQIIRDSVRVRDSVVLVVDSAGKTIGFKYYHYENIWHDGSINTTSMAQKRDSVAHTAQKCDSVTNIQVHEEKAVKSKNTPWWWMIIVVLGVVGVIGVIFNKYGRDD